ncbi:LOW QUALITY PROTEIN: uncharacterized protein LOC124274613, partial [Haliotis rubra]|uniref:LOW QUALITY PROTEIN: uncharacterized protein LOC124274613 n=1 Tax=Haliotis rubra TaxID=36100 RepID=UPI001EE62004
LQTCARGTFFDGKKCRHAEEVDCKDDPCKRHPPGYAYSDGAYCYGYYICERRRSVYRRCRQGFAFRGKRCIRSPSCKQYSWKHKGLGCPPHVNPYPGNPTKFYLAGAGGVIYKMPCPDGLLFNPRKCACDWGFHPPKQRCSALFNFMFNGNTLDEFNKASLTTCGPVAPSYDKVRFDKGGYAVIWMMDGLDLDSMFALTFFFHYLGKDKGEVALMANDFKDDLYFTLKMTLDTVRGEVIARMEGKDGRKMVLVVKGVAPHLKHRVWLSKYKSAILLKVDNLPPTKVVHGAGIKIKNSPLVVGMSHGTKGFVGFMDNIRLTRCPEEVARPSHVLKRYGG